MTSITVYILCHNRPSDAMHAIQSALAQSDASFQLIISDNSSDAAVQTLVEQQFPAVTYRRRPSDLTALAHFNTCIDENTSDYFCLFHDDDLLESNFIVKIREAIAVNADCAAIACNAFLENFGKLEQKHSFKYFRKYKKIHSGKELGHIYFSRAQSGIAPFPSYVYKQEAIKDLRFNLGGGKYSDVTWLMQVASKGGLVWINEPLMTYRIHSSNDGGIESRRDRLRLLAYLKREEKQLGGNLIEDFRCSFIYKEILKDEKYNFSSRQMIGSRFLSCYKFARYLRFDTYSFLFFRLINKWMPSP